MSVNKKWGTEEVVRAIEMLERGDMITEISKHLGRTYECVRKMFKRKGVRPRRTLSAIRVEESKRRRAEREQRLSARVTQTKNFVPPRLFEERDARMNEPRTFSMEQFGDPPPSQSALYKKLGSGGPPPELSAPGATSPALGATIQRDA